jgi:hypothetical protein
MNWLAKRFQYAPVANPTMIDVVAETIDQVAMTDLSAKIDLKVKIDLVVMTDLFVKIGLVVKTEVAVNNAETEEDGKTVLVAMIVEVVITVVTNMEITTGIALNARIPTSPSAQNVIAVVNLKVKEEAEGAVMIAKIIPVAVKVVAEIIVAISTVITTGIALNARIPTSPSAQNVIAVANLKVKEEAEDAVMIAEIIPVAVKTIVAIAEAMIVEINMATMIGTAQNVKTRILVSALNVIAVANPKDKAARITAAVAKVMVEEEIVVHAAIQDQLLVINAIVDHLESTN